MRTLPIVIALAVAVPLAGAQASDLFGKAKNLLGGAVPGQSSTGSGAAGLQTSEIIAGLKEALRVGSSRVVSQVSATDGFNGDSLIHIPLPDKMAKAKKALSRFGMSGTLDDLELRLNRAAETASAKAGDLFVSAVEQMTVEDAASILNGPKDAATQYFRRTMSPGLTAEMKPVVDQSLAEVGAISAYENAVGQAKANPLLPDIRADLSDHVVKLGLDGIFHYLAREEAAIRENPAARTTALLQKVFAN